MKTEQGSFTVSGRDWELHRKGPKDEGRHNEKVKQAIKDNLPEIVSHGDLITADPVSRRIIRIPLPSLELPDFRFGRNDQGAGTGEGEGGDVIGKRPGEGEGESGAGDQPGVEYYETDLTIEELKEMVFQDLGLPYIEPKKSRQVVEKGQQFDNLAHRPRLTNIDYIKTAVENMKRNAQERGFPIMDDFTQDDIWIRTWKERITLVSNAVVLVMADGSGSMNTDFKKYIVRSFSWWLVEALRHIYPHVEIIFIIHAKEAYEVDEKQFFSRGMSGGTMCSSANQMALDIIKKRFSPQNYNVYPCHFSDGDNFDNDNDTCIRLVQQLLELNVNQYAYIQVGNDSWAKLMKLYKERVKHERFHGLHIAKKEDLYPALKEVLDAERQ